MPLEEINAVRGQALAELQVWKYPSLIFQTLSLTNSCYGSLPPPFLPLDKASKFKSLAQDGIADYTTFGICRISVLPREKEEACEGSNRSFVPNSSHSTNMFTALASSLAIIPDKTAERNAPFQADEDGR